MSVGRGEGCVVGCDGCVVRGEEYLMGEDCVVSVVRSWL